MKLKYKQVEKEFLSSIYVERVHKPYIGGHWHFHKEFELIYFLEGNGMRIVGDHISNFQKGELVLVSEWLPHLWRNEVDDSTESNVDFIVIKFPKEFQGIPLFSLHELAGIRNLLNKSYRGVLFSETVLPKVHDAILRLSESRSGQILINFLQVLQYLSTAKDYQLLSSPDFAIPSHASKESRLQKVINYISVNYNHGIPLEEIAGVAHMTTPSFCRFFKNRTNKTFSQFLNEFRVSKACQFLISGEMPMKQICFQVGFNSLTNFNRSFKSIKGITPTAYRDKYFEFRR